MMKILDRRPYENARNYAVRVLLYNIINLNLAPGSAVSENELSSALSLSRTPVREALIELSRINLVEILPQRGSYISKIDYERVEEARFVRLVIENAILKLACQGIEQDNMDKLKDNLEQQKKVYESGDTEAFFDLDNQFHQLLFTSVGKTWSYTFIRDQMVHFDRLRSLSLQSFDDEELLRDHEDIVYAISRKDAEMAEMLMTRHLMRYQVQKSELLERYPDYFC